MRPLFCPLLGAPHCSGAVALQSARHAPERPCSRAPVLQAPWESQCRDGRCIKDSHAARRTPGGLGSANYSASTYVSPSARAARRTPRVVAQPPVLACCGCWPLQACGWARLAGLVWLGSCGWACLAGLVWLGLSGWTRVAGLVWLGSSGWTHLAGLMWLGSCGWARLAGLVWLGSCGWARLAGLVWLGSSG